MTDPATTDTSGSMGSRVVSAIRDLVTERLDERLTEYVTQDELDEREDGLPTQGNPYAIGAECDHQTIQAAYDAALQAGAYPQLQITQSYDPTAETYPIQLTGHPKTRAWHPFTLQGYGPGCQIGHTGVTGDIIQVHGPPAGGQEAYKKPAVLRDFRTRGGDGGAQIHIAGLPNGRIRDVLLLGRGHGVQWTAPFLEMATTDDGSEITSHSFGWDLHSVTAWGCQAGFKAGRGASAHSTSFTHCRANNCYGAGLHWSGAVSLTWRGGDIQLNRAYGAALRGCEAVTIRDAYVEGNGRTKDTSTELPVEVYAKDTNALTIDSCYFHGINPRSVTHEYNEVQRGVNVHDSKAVNVTNNHVRRYGDGFVSAMNNSQVELHGNHIPSDDDTTLTGKVTRDSTITAWGDALE